MEILVSEKADVNAKVGLVINRRQAKCGTGVPKASMDVSRSPILRVSPLIFQCHENKTPLHMTALHGRFTRAITLIEKGADVDAVDKTGNTALHIAARYGHELLIDTLLSNRANPLR